MDKKSMLSDRLKKIFSHDRVFAILLFGFLFVRGLSLCSVVMPFEGFDEANFMAVAAYVDKNDKMPLTTDLFPTDKKFQDFLHAHPHPYIDPGTGLKDYSGKTWEENHPEEVKAGNVIIQYPNMYQAQFGPFYYRLLVGMKRLLGIDSYLVWADWARILNIFFAALTPLIWFWIFRLWFKEGRARSVPYFAAIIFAANSILIFSAARVASEALAVFFGSAAFLAFMAFAKSDSRSFKHGIILCLLCGACGGIAVISKVTAITAMPIIGVGILLKIWRMRGEWRWKGVVLPVLLVVSYFIIAGPRHWDCYKRTGTLAENYLLTHAKEKGKTSLDGIKAIVSLRFDDTKHYLLYNFAYMGTWSFRPQPSHTKALFRKLLRISLIIFVLIMFSAQRRREFYNALKSGWEPVLHIPLTWLALLYSAGLSMLVIGQIAGNTRYALLAFPAIIALFILPPVLAGRRIGAFMTLAFTALFSVIFYLAAYCDLILYQTRENDLKDAINYLQSHHSKALHLPIPTMLTVEIILLGCAMYVALAQTRKFYESDTGESDSSTGESPMRTGQA